MTSSEYIKVFKQLKNKPEKLNKYLKHNSPKKRSVGKSLRKCGVCGNPRGHIKKYGVNMCRRCFRDNALKMGFKKYD